MELEIQHFPDNVTEAWKPIRDTMLERVKLTNMNRSKSQTGDYYMSQLKYTMLGCNFTKYEERIRDQFIRGINSQNTRKNV